MCAHTQSSYIVTLKLIKISQTAQLCVTNIQMKNQNIFSIPKAFLIFSFYLYISFRLNTILTVTQIILPAAAAAAKLLQSCPILCDPVDSSPPGFPVPGILQARTLEWVAISFSNAWKWKVKVKSLSRARLLATPWTAAYQAPPSMGFPGKSTGVGCHCILRILPTFAFYVNRTKNTVCNFSLCDWLFSLKVVFVGISILLLIAVHC